MSADPMRINFEQFAAQVQPADGLPVNPVDTDELAE
jgi:hypothetical protein